MKPGGLGLSRWLRTFESFRYRDFRFLWGTGFGYSGGYWVQQIAIGWLAYDVTKSPFITSVALGLDALPVFLAGPLGGVLVDAWDRRKVLAFATAYQALLSLGFSMLVMFGEVATWHLLLFTGLIGISWALVSPANMSLIPRVVPSPSLVNAFALTSIAFSSSRLIAPAIGGVMIAAAGPGPTLLLETGLQVGACVMALSMKPSMIPSHKVRPSVAVVQLKEAVAYARKDSRVVGLLLFSAIPPALLVPFSSGLMPVYAVEVFHVGPKGLGLLLAFMGVGAVVGNLVLAALGTGAGKGRLLIATIVVAAVALLLLSLNRNFGAGLFIMFLVGIGWMASYTIAGASLQAIASEQYRGRVAGLFQVAWGLTPFGAFMAGATAEAVGVAMASLIAAGAIGLCTLVLAVRFASIRRLV